MIENIIKENISQTKIFVFHLMARHITAGMEWKTLMKMTEIIYAITYLKIFL